MRDSSTTVSGICICRPAVDGIEYVQAVRKNKCIPLAECGKIVGSVIVDGTISGQKSCLCGGKTEPDVNGTRCKCKTPSSILHVDGTCSSTQCGSETSSSLQGERASDAEVCDCGSDSQSSHVLDLTELGKDGQRKCIQREACSSYGSQTGTARYLTHDGKYCVANCYTEDYSGDGDRYAVGLDRKACQPIAYSETDKQYYCVDASSKQPLQGTNSVDIQNEAVCECL